MNIRALGIFAGDLFHASSFDGFTYDEAVAYCKGQNASLASTGDLYSAWKQGFDMCRKGWLLDHSVRYAINKPQQQCGGGKAGVHTVYTFPNQTGFPDLNTKFDAYCLKGKYSSQVQTIKHTMTAFTYLMHYKVGYKMIFLFIYSGSGCVSE